MTNTTPSRLPAATRAALPEILLTEDLALVLGVSPGTARRLVRTGACGPFGRIGRRLFVRRDVLLETLAEREVLVTGGPPW